MTIHLQAIVKNITELFYQHDCVVVPRLGGFIANYQPAFFDATTQLLNPPKKEFIFNRFLLHNDGLLAHQLCADLGVSYNEAVVLIDQFVDAIFVELKSNNRCEIDLVGTLYYDNNQHLRLNGHNQNYLLSSFGLPMVKRLPLITPLEKDTTPVISIHREVQVDKKDEQQIQDDKVITISRSTKSSNAKWWVAAAMLPIAFYSAWIPMKTDLFKKEGHFHYSDLNPFVFEKPVGTYSQLDGFAMRIDTLVFEHSQAKQLELASKSNIDSSVYEDVTSAIDSVENKAIPKGEFHLIGGCFSSEENATNFVSDMTGQGLSAQIIDQAGGLYRVSLVNCATSEEAAAQKSKLQNDLNLSTWILKKVQK